jgi:hypothetical protein
MHLVDNILAETVASLVGIFVGMLAALAVDRHNEHRRNQRRARTILFSLTQELNENYTTLQAVKSAYTSTAWGKSFYISTIAWETALASGDLPDVIGFELVNTISGHYALLVRIRYHVDLLTRLWFAPSEIQGYDEIRQGFVKAILSTMTQVNNQHSGVMKLIQQGR